MVALARPETRKYVKNLVLTLMHAGLFMYLPNIYQDISQLMNLKVGLHDNQLIWNTYLLTLGKWSFVFGAMGALTYQRRYEFLDISNRLAIRLRYALYNKTLYNNIYKKSAASQRYSHHLINDIRTVSEFLGQTVFHGFRGFLFLIGGSLCLIYSSPHLSVLAVLIMACLNIVFRSKNLRLKQYKVEENQGLNDLNVYASERLHNSKLIKISNTQKHEEVGYLRELSKLYQKSRQVAKANGLNYGMLEGVGLFAIFAVAATGSLLITLNITQFNLLASSTYALYVALGFRSVMNFNTEMMKAVGVYDNFAEKLGDVSTNFVYNGQLPILHLQERQKQVQKESSAVPTEHYEQIRIKFENVKFKYKAESNSGLKSVNLTIEPGEVTAIVGRSGIGKSTLLNLVTKLYEPESGTIYLNDRSLKQTDDRFIQQNISYVTQDTFIFSGSFMSNIAYGNQGFDITEQRIIECLKIAQAYDFVIQKGGLKGVVKQNGSNLSGGQKQKLMLARALIKKPAVLILDEATANIDTFSEYRIFKNLEKLYNNATIIVISHKLDQIEEFIDRRIDFEKLNES